LLALVGNSNSEKRKIRLFGDWDFFTNNNNNKKK
jgi:hypothetical protein